jgi:hypothetical protein
LRMQRYCFFLKQQKKTRFFYKKPQKNHIYSLFYDDSTYLCM